MSLTSRAQQQCPLGPASWPRGCTLPEPSHGSLTPAPALESGQDTGTGMFFSFTNYLENVTHTPLQQSPLIITLQL